ncbi:MAG: hypothetical protein ABJB03_01695 [Rhodoglobus sp.]
MDEAGWTGTKQPNGIYDYTYSDEQRSAFDTASAACVDQIGGNLPIERSTAEWRDLYDFYVDTQACLEAAGVDIPTAPSFAVWAESGHGWTPYETVRPDVIGSEEFEELVAACPQAPEE